MADLPTFDELYAQMESQVTGDSTTDLNDFSDGGALDTFAGVAATVGRGVCRYFADKLSTAFFQTAEGADLDYLATDRFGSADGAPERQTGESDEAFLDRIYSYIDSLNRGTPNAIEHWLLTYDGRADDVRLVEDSTTGITDVYITPSDEVADVDVYLDELRADLDKWRALNAPVNLREET